MALGLQPHRGMAPEISETSGVPSGVSPTGCCARFDPTPWDRQEIVWLDELFVKQHVRSLLYVPINMGGKITEAMARIEQAAAAHRQPLMLVDHVSAWGSELYIRVSRPVAGAHMASLSGTFLTRVFEGPYRDAARWAQAMKSYVDVRGKSMVKLYYAYTTCPACAKAYGENYVVLFAQIAEGAGDAAA